MVDHGVAQPLPQALGVLRPLPNGACHQVSQACRAVHRVRGAHERADAGPSSSQRCVGLG